MESSIPSWLNTFEEEIDSYIFISSRDNKLYLGILRSYDQYGNIFLTHCVEKIIVTEKNYFTDIYVGNLIIRGDNIVYFGCVDEDKYDQIFDYSHYQDIETKEFENLETNNTQQIEKIKEEKDHCSNNITLKEDNIEGDKIIILQYKPINCILKLITDNTIKDNSVFGN